MPVMPNNDSEENKEYWAFVEKTSEEVRSWPAWMRGDYSNRGGKPICGDAPTRHTARSSMTSGQTQQEAPTVIHGEVHHFDGIILGFDHGEVYLEGEDGIMLLNPATDDEAMALSCFLRRAAKHLLDWRKEMSERAKV